MMPEQSERKGGLRRRDAAGLPLRIGISTRALFDLEAEHSIFEEQGLEAYLRSQRASESTPIGKGAGFNLVSRFLSLNEVGREPLVEVVLLSRNGPEASLRAFDAIHDHGLKIACGSFTGGQSVGPFLKAWGVDLFLSKESADVQSANILGVAAGMIGALPPQVEKPGPLDAIRIALDGDAVVFGDEAERVFAERGLDAFLRHEAEHARVPINAGPFRDVLCKLVALREARRAIGRSDQIRLALVTARTAPAHARVVRTLQAWGIEIDEIHFVGKGAKAPILKAFGADIFFDDQERHVALASSQIVSARVLGRESSLPV